MKSFKEFITEAVVRDIRSGSNDIKDKLLKMNAGREGDTALTVNGEEVEKSVYLGSGNNAYIDGSGNLIINIADPISGKTKAVSLSKKEKAFLKKLY